MRQSTVILLAILAGTLFAAWFFSSYEKVVRTEYTGFHGEARFNEFLAADMLLNDLGIDADSVPSLTPSDWLPEWGDTLVAHLSTNIAVGIERQRLIEWVSNGGHLVLIPQRFESRGVEEFTESLGFRIVEVDADGETAPDDDSEVDGDEEDYDYQLDLSATPVRIELDDADVFDATLSDDEGFVAARRRWHDGYVTVIAGPYYFSNYYLDDSDHARLLLDVVAGYVEPGKVWFVFGGTFPSLWQVIWNAVPYAVAGAALLLVLWLWSVMPRFGPPIRQAPPVRRSIIEHVRAAGHFVWRHNGARALATSSATAIMHDAEIRHPGIGRLPLEKQAKQIARMTGIPAEAIFDVLVNRDEPRHREFTQNMRAQQRIRKEL